MHFLINIQTDVVPMWKTQCFSKTSFGRFGAQIGLPKRVHIDLQTAEFDATKR